MPSEETLVAMGNVVEEALWDSAYVESGGPWEWWASWLLTGVALRGSLEDADGARARLEEDYDAIEVVHRELSALLARLDALAPIRAAIIASEYDAPDWWEDEPPPPRTPVVGFDSRPRKPRPAFERGRAECRAVLEEASR